MGINLAREMYSGDTCVYVPTAKIWKMFILMVDVTRILVTTEVLRASSFEQEARTL